jgi:DNA-binding response OmpR family regulator
MENRLPSPRFLIVEDEVMITILLEDYMEELGFKAAWQADSIESALKIIEGDSDIEGAILDVNIRGKTIQPVADALAARKIPFCFMTGYGSAAATGYPDAPIIGKPFDIVALENTLRSLIT